VALVQDRSGGRERDVGGHLVGDRLHRPPDHLDRDGIDGGASFAAPERSLAGSLRGHAGPLRRNLTECQNITPEGRWVAGWVRTAAGDGFGGSDLSARSLAAGGGSA